MSSNISSSNNDHITTTHKETMTTTTNDDILPGFIRQYDPLFQKEVLFQPVTGEIIHEWHYSPSNINNNTDNDNDDDNVVVNNGSYYINRRTSLWTKPTTETTTSQNDAAYPLSSPSQRRSIAIRVNDTIKSLHHQQQSLHDHANLHPPPTTITDDYDNPHNLLSYHGPRLARRIATKRLRRFIKLVLSRLYLRQLIRRTYRKRFDYDCGLYYFINIMNDASGGWYRPLSFLGLSLYDGAVGEVIPEEDDDNENQRNDDDDDDGGECKDDRQTVVYMMNRILSKTTTTRNNNDDDDDNNNITTSRRHDNDCLQGPYASRRPHQPGRHVLRRLTKRDLHSSFDVVDRSLFNVISHPRDIDPRHHHYVATLENDHVTRTNTTSPSSLRRYGTFDGHLFKTLPCPIDTYTLLRGAYDHGPTALMNLLSHHTNNRTVILFGCLSLSKMTNFGKTNPNGTATEESRRCCHLIFRVLKDWRVTKDEGSGVDVVVMAGAMAVLVTLSDDYANRVVIHEWEDDDVDYDNEDDNEEEEERGWVKITTTLIHQVVTKPTTIAESSGGGMPTAVIIDQSATTTTTSSGTIIDCVVNVCRLYSNMAYDEQSREYVADRGMPLVAKIMDCYGRDPYVFRCCCMALYNFCYRNDRARSRTMTDDYYKRTIMAFIESVGDDFPNDEELMRVAKRTLMIIKDGNEDG